MENILCVIAGKFHLAEGVIRLDLISANGETLPAWSPGAHIDLHLPGGIIRQYSLCSSPDDPNLYSVAVLLAPNTRGGSQSIHENIQVGDEILISTPRNQFPMGDHPDYIFIAGGIGITPMLSMVEKAEAMGKSMRLVYGGRTRDSMAFLSELSRRKVAIEICPQDEFGLLDLDGALAAAGSDTGIYVCGPEALISAVELKCSERKLESSLHFERFAPKNMPDQTNQPFTLILSQSGIEVEVEQDESALDALAKAGILIISSCREGTCGTCETRVLSGEIDHRDSVLTKAEQDENEYMMVCVSRSKSKSLTLDI